MGDAAGADGDRGAAGGAEAGAQPAAAGPRPERNLADLVTTAAAATPDKAAFRYRDAAISWSALDARMRRVAAGLTALGLAPGDRVALRLANTPDFPACYFGVLRAGLVAVPVNVGCTGPELDHVLGDSGSRVLLTGPRDLPEGRARTVEHLLVTGTGTPERGRRLEDVLPAGDVAGGPQRGGEDLAVVLYTSGTSGRPRGAMLSHRALLANLEQCAAIRPPVMTADDVVLLVLPLSHIFGLNAALGLVTWYGATGVLVERFDPVGTLEVVRHEQVTNLVGAPPLYLAWSQLPQAGESLAGVRLAVSGSAPLPPAVQRRFLVGTGHHVFEGYGLTESGPVLTTTLLSEAARPGTIGRPLPGVELRLLGEDGREVDEGDTGEIVVRGPHLFSGYWPDGADGPDEQGWFATGDLALVDSEGDLRLVDRRRELVLVRGFNVYPREVEEVLAAHPAVAEAAVLGVPDATTGEAVKALVVLRPGASAGPEELIAWCARSLARFKCPTVVKLVPDLPHSATGKVSKGRLREAERPGDGATGAGAKDAGDGAAAGRHDGPVPA